MQFAKVASEWLYGTFIATSSEMTNGSSVDINSAGMILICQNCTTFTLRDFLNLNSI